MDNLYKEVSGIEAFTRAYDGEYAQYSTNNSDWCSFEKCSWDFDELRGKTFKFRVKRQTLKINVEIPKPFTPKHGEEYWYVCSLATENVNKTVYGGDGVDKTNQMLGYYKTKEDALLAFEILSKAVLGENN